MNMDFPYMLEILPEVASYIPTTLVLAFVSMFFAVVIGLIIAFGRRSKIKLSQVYQRHIFLYSAGYQQLCNYLLSTLDSHNYSHLCLTCLQ